MARKVYCDKCGKEIHTQDLHLGVASSDELFGQEVAVAIGGIAYDSKELCQRHVLEFEALWAAFLGQPLGEN